MVAEPTEVHYPYGRFRSSFSLGQAPKTQTQKACPRPRSITTMKAPYSLSEFGKRSICQKSAGLHEVLVGFELLVGKSPLEKNLNFDGLSRQETYGQHFPMNCSKIGHSYEALRPTYRYLFG